MLGVGMFPGDDFVTPHLGRTFILREKGPGWLWAGSQWAQHSALLSMTQGHRAGMPEGIPKNTEFSQLLVYLGIPERSEFGFVFWSFAFHWWLIFFSPSCNCDAESFGSGILLSLGFSTCWNELLFPGKVTSHLSLSAKPLFLVSPGVFLPQSHSLHSLSIEFSLYLSKADFRDPTGSVVAFRAMLLTWVLCRLDALIRHWWFLSLLPLLEWGENVWRKSESDSEING